MWCLKAFLEIARTLLDRVDWQGAVTHGERSKRNVGTNKENGEAGLHSVGGTNFDDRV